MIWLSKSRFVFKNGIDAKYNIITFIQNMTVKHINSKFVLTVFSILAIKGYKNKKKKDMLILLAAGKKNSAMYNDLYFRLKENQKHVKKVDEYFDF